jgi:hypothetical protein
MFATKVPERISIEKLFIVVQYWGQDFQSALGYFIKQMTPSILQPLLVVFVHLVYEPSKTNFD